MEPFSGELQGRLGAFRALKAAEVRRVFSHELRRRPPAARRRLAAALVATSSWNTWQALREQQGLSQGEARRVLRLMLDALLEEARWTCTGPRTIASTSSPATRSSRATSRPRVSASTTSTSGQPHTTIAGGGHFLQEDRGVELARVVVDFLARS